MRLYEPRALIRTGMSEPSTFSKRTAGPEVVARIGGPCGRGRRMRGAA